MWDIGILSKYLYLTQPCLLLLPMKKSCCDVGRSIFYLLQQYMKELFSTSVIIFLCTNCYILFFWLSENSLTLALNFFFYFCSGVPSTASTDILMDLLSIGSSPSQNGTPGQGKNNLSCSNCLCFYWWPLLNCGHTDAAESKPVHAVPEAIDLLGSLSSTTSVSG